MQAQCTTCQRWVLAKRGFYLTGRKQCLRCYGRQYQRRWKLLHPGQAQARMAKWHKENRKRSNATAKAGKEKWARENPEAYREYCRKKALAYYHRKKQDPVWLKKYRARQAQYRANWKKNNPEAYAIKVAKQREKRHKNKNV